MSDRRRNRDCCGRFSEVYDRIHGVGKLAAERDDIVTLLRFRRQQMRLSQRTLASQIGTSGQMLSEYEQGKTTPNLSTLLRWAMALDCRIEVCAR